LDSMRIAGSQGESATCLLDGKAAMRTKHRIAIRIRKLPQLLSLVCGMIYLAHIAVLDVHAQHTCKVNLRQIGRDIERYRRGETPGIDSKYELTECRQTLPLLEKYIVDRDPEVRNLLVDYLSASQRRPQAQVARLLVKQIEAYPLNNRAVDRLHAHSACHIVKQVRTRRFTEALVNRVNATDGSPSTTFDKAGEIYLLGCVASRDITARRFLERLRSESFPTNRDSGSSGNKLQDIRPMEASSLTSGSRIQ
jgi:hypothetical protein